MRFYHTLVIVNHVIDGDTLRWLPLEETSFNQILDSEEPGGVSCVPFTSGGPEVNSVAQIRELEEDLLGVWPMIAVLGE